jgi:thiamine-phosphate pyrophosphorylase
MAPAPRLIAITDLGVLARESLAARLAELAANAAPGTLALLLRDHSSSAKERLALGHELREITQSFAQELWVADRLDLALLLQADVAHLGEASVSASVARRLVGADMRISRAWHASSLSGVENELHDVDALVVSPVMAPRKGRPALGPAALGVLGEQLRARNQACQLYALGGVSAANAAACRAAGAWGVAAIGAALTGNAVALLDALEIRR